MHIQNSQIYKKIIGSIPYITTIITGIVIYILAGITHGKFSELLVNIAASFFAIPLLYLFYEKARAFSHERLHKEIFDYAKMQVDREVLSIINQLKKTVLTIEDDNPTIKTVNEFLSNKKEDLVRELRTNKYIGFQVFKNWEISEKTLHDLLKNPFVLEKMKDEQIISVIGILKSLRDLEEIQKSGKL